MPTVETGLTFQLEEDWAFQAQSTLYSRPLAANVTANSGMEIIICDAEVRLLRCIDASGRQLWQYDGGWRKRLTATPALSFNAHPDFPLLAIGNADGQLCCLRADTGQEVWTTLVGGIEWGSPVWADLDGDGQDELLVATEVEGITAFRTDGTRLWTYRQDIAGNPLVIRCPITAQDIDGDGRAEVFVCDRWGPLCLNSTGKLRWHQRPGHEFLSGLTVADLEGDGRYDVLCAAKDDNLLFRLEAESGNIVWQIPLLAGCDVYSNSYYPTGDLDGDGRLEVIACDDNGNIYCLNSQGQHLWTFLTPKPVHTAATVADLEKTGQLSMIASGDHSLYLLNADGNLVGRYEEDRRLIAPATVADIHNDGKMRLLFGGSGCKLNCISVAKSIPIEGDTTSAAQVQVLNTSKVEETYPLLEGGDFESTQALLADDEYPGDTDFAARKRMRPGGWRPDSILPVDDNWQRDQQEKFTGQASIKVIPVAASFVLASEQIEIDPDFVTVEAEIMGRGGGAAAAALRWTGLKGRLRQDPLTPSPADKNGWCRF